MRSFPCLVPPPRPQGRGERIENGFQTHLFEYRHEGATWTIEVKASSEADARARIANLQYGTYLGTLQFKVPVELGVLAKMICWLQNRRRGEGAR